MTDIHSPTATNTASLRLGRRIAVAGLVGGPLLNAAEAVISRQLAGGGGDMGDGAVVLAAVDSTPGLMAAGVLAAFLAAPLILFMGWAIALLMRNRLPRLSKVTSVFAAVGAFGYAASAGVMAAGNALSRLPDRAQAAVLYTDLMSGSSIPVLVIALAFLVGMFGMVVLIGIGMWRASIAPRWALVSLAVFVILDLGYGAVGPVEQHWFFVAAILPIAVKVARMTDADWAIATAPTPGNANVV